jgi:hypothetical protein
MQPFSGFSFMFYFDILPPEILILLYLEFEE